MHIFENPITRISTKTELGHRQLHDEIFSYFIQWRSEWITRLREIRYWTSDKHVARLFLCYCLRFADRILHANLLLQAVSVSRYALRAALDNCFNENTYVNRSRSPSRNRIHAYHAKVRARSNSVPNVVGFIIVHMHSRLKLKLVLPLHALKLHKQTVVSWIHFAVNSTKVFSGKFETSTYFGCCWFGE